ncbi:HD domain-containing phosphohydrolase [Sulfurimonas sp.]|uniref:HD-GYP domain-containing protein n=1 Tax=Sulfurimonas sp. TaxID=2022749 RepID=UPI0025F1B29D|nr:HD domain-containing phosphohydrolase [Sulfurimonas sp.]
MKHYIKYNKDDHKKRLQLLYEVNNQLFEIFMINKENRLNIGCVELIIDAIIYLLKYDDAFIKNTMPHMLSDYMLENHSLHVAIYALTLGYRLKFSDEQLLKLGSAALLHDIGIKRIDKDIIYKKRSLSPNETALVQKHSQYSVEILKQNKIHDPYIIDAVMHHHECYDGTGYPNRLTKDDISDFASILSICDVFDALTNNRPYRAHYSSFDALKMMMRDPSMVNRFNQSYLHLALKLL